MTLSFPPNTTISPQSNPYLSQIPISIPMPSPTFSLEAAAVLPQPPPQTPFTLPTLCADILLLISKHLSLLSPESSTPLKNLCLTTRRLHGILAPELFKTLRLAAPIKFLSEKYGPLAYLHAHTLKVDLFGSMWWWCSGAYVSGTDARDVFGLVARLERLRVLEVRMMGRSGGLFEAAFEDVGAQGKGKKGEGEGEGEKESLFLLPQIEELVVTNCAAFLARLCPNLKTLVLRQGGECAVEAYAPLSVWLGPLRLKALPGARLLSGTLRSLEANAAWSVLELHFITVNFPHLRHLHMRRETYCYHAPVSTIALILGQGCKALQTLRLSRISYLDVGFRSMWKRQIQECKSEDTRMWLWRDNEARRVSAENDVVRLFFAAVGSLRDVWVGEARVARRMQGCDYEGREARWMWERESEDVFEDDCANGSLSAKYQTEREAVIKRWEIGS